MKLKDKKLRFKQKICLRPDDLHCQVGDHVIDLYGDEGIVVKVLFGSDQEDHGTLTVWQINRTEYGADNCEHYAEINWKECIKVLKKAGT